jgi:surface protein
MSKLIVSGTGVRIAPLTTTPTPQTYVRNPSWPACEANIGDNRMRGLYAVWPQGGNFFAAYAVGTGTPAYNIDFGDGTTTDYNSGTVAYYEYDYNSVALDGTNAPVTFTASTNTVNRTAHGYTNGMQVRLYDIATTTGIQEATPYYVTNATLDTFQLSSSQYDMFSFINESSPSGMFFKPDGTKIYITGSTNDRVYQFPLSTPWDLSTVDASNSFNDSLSIAPQASLVQSISFKPDGTKMYIVGSTSDLVSEYDLSIPWDTSSASFLQSFSTAFQENQPAGMFFKPDGTKMYIIGYTNDRVYEYDLSISWDVSSSTYTGNNFNVTSQDTLPNGISFKPDGTKMYITGNTNDNVYEYDLSTPWNVTSASYLQAFNVLVEEDQIQDVLFKPDGTKMYIVGTSKDAVIGYTLTTPWDISTATFDIINPIVELTNDGSAALLPYKIATVTIAPQVGQNITTLDLFRKHNQVGLVNNYSSGWLDISVALPSVTSIIISSSPTTIVNHGYCDRVRLNQLGNVTQFASIFYNMYNLKNVVISEDITTLTTTGSMFYSCYSLLEVPLFNTSNVTNMSSMFLECNSLLTVPLFDTSNVTNMTSMFIECNSLSTVPLFDTSKVTNMTQMFYNCSDIASIPSFDTANVTNMSYMFYGCSSLSSVPLLDTSKVTNMSNLFFACNSLITVPLFNTSNVTAMDNMFYACSSLTSVPLFNTYKVTNMTSMFQGCYSLYTVPLFNTISVINMSNMFYLCNSLTSVPLFNTSKVTNMTNMFYNCKSLITVPQFNTSLVTLMSGMFYSCRSLTFVPLFDTSKVTTMSTMFQNCFDIMKIPAFNTPVVTTFSNMFNGCRSLTEVPNFNMYTPTSSSGYTTMFTNCLSLSQIRATSFRFTFTVANCKLSATAIEEIYSNLGSVTTSQTLTVTGNYGVDPAITKAVSVSDNTYTVLMANTSGIEVGQFVSGLGMGISNNGTINSDVTNNLFNKTSHGLQNGEIVAFSARGTTTGIDIRTIYYVVNATANTFQVALTPGGEAIDLTGSNSFAVVVQWPNYVTEINPNVSITLSNKTVGAFPSSTLAFRRLDSSKALLKGWTVTF